MAWQGIRSYLTQGIGGVIDVIDPTGSVIQMTSLGIALQCMTSEHRLLEVRRLLNEGADPNEKNREGISEWISYIIATRNGKLSEKLDLEKKLETVKYDTRMLETEAKIIQSLLLHGADPRIGGEEHHFSQLLKKLHLEDDIKLKELRQHLLPAKVEQQQVVDYRQRTLPNRKRSLREGSDPRTKPNGRTPRKRPRKRR